MRSWRRTLVPSVWAASRSLFVAEGALGLALARSLRLVGGPRR
jgi:hypothetical protein